MIQIIDKSLCTGCTACYSICPSSCISMRSDDHGFLYPTIDFDLCTACGLCKCVCPFLQSDDSRDFSFSTPLIYAVKHSDDFVRLNSSSGGMFTAVSDLILSYNGIVYGASFNPSLRVEHRRAETHDQRNALRKSKYVQSDLKDTFLEIKEFLHKDRHILFTGTPCQTYGLKSFLRHDYERLITCDFVCHGVPSAKLFRDYLDFIESKYKSSVIKYDFRPKTKGWHNYSPLVTFNNGKIAYNTSIVNTYMSIYFSNVAFRPSCYKCMYSTTHRSSDITLGDFWGIEQCHSDFVDDFGISLVILNTKKGFDLFKKIQSQLTFISSTLDNCFQHNLMFPSQTKLDRDRFWNEYSQYGYKFLAIKYGHYTIYDSIKKLIKRILIIIKMLKSYI